MIKRKIGSIVRVGEGPTNVYSFLARSADAANLPTAGVGTGSCCVMQDTGDLYVYHEDEGWVLVPFSGGGTPTPTPTPTSAAFENLVRRVGPSLEFPSDLDEIGNYAFYNFANLQRIDAWGGIQTIGQYAFYGCTNLTVTEWPENIETIYQWAFGNGTKIACEEAPKIATLETSTFENAVFTGSVFKLNGPFTSIPSTFMRGATLGVLEIGDTVTHLNWQCFANSTMTEARIKRRPSYINNTIFTGCSSLADIYVSWSDGAVSGAPWGAPNATIHYDTAF